MRLHSLEVTAFGPFAETVTVDFDTLSDAGLFLLTGPTGAGKTSVLDAVCFALYGDVPGDRNTVRRFRCDASAPGLAPRVVLHATLAGRGFRLTRSPQWERPKKRGTGTTSENAKVLVEESINGEWVMLTGRIDEAGQLVTELLGMTMPQFCQVAMLPQGRFQSFLRARSEDRHRLLQQLFSTQRFEDVEKWLREHTRHLHRESRELHQAVSRTLSRVLEASGSTLPADWPEVEAAPSAEDVDLVPPARTGRLATWSTALAEEADVAATTAGAAADETRARARELSAQVETVRRQVELRRRHAAAQQSLADLSVEAPAHDSRITQLEAARVAAPVRGLDALARRKADRLHHAAQEAETASRESLALIEEQGLFELPVEAEGALERLTDERLERARDEVRDLVSRSAALAPRERELARLTRQIDQDTARVSDLQARVAAHQRRIEELPTTITALEQRLETARAAEARAGSLDDALRQVEGRLEAHRRLEALRQEADQADADLREHTEHCLALKETWLELREARLHGMAAEIANDLAVGACCPVCGSADHPHKAQPAPGAPSARAEKTARKELDTAEATRTALDGKVRDLTVQLAVVEKEAGTTAPEALEAERVRLSAELDAARTTAGGVAEVQPMLARSLQSLDRAHREHATLATELATTATRLETDTVTAREVTDEVGALLRRTGHETLADQVRFLDLAGGVHDEAVRRRSQWRAAEEAATDAELTLTAWLEDHGFESRAQALGASLPEEELTTLAEQVRAHQDRLAAARATLDDPEVHAAAEGDAPDLPELEREAARLAEEADSAGTKSRLAHQRADRLRRLDAELRGRLDAWAPVRERYATAADLASFVEGKGQDNELRMRLSAYVLAWRLAQVVAAANERLLRMSDQRYTLEHSGRRGAGESRGGLSLRVRDEWSGDARDPATLSGGETFVVSLALALGLADVVTREAGGADLDTLFVDEGFGALDAETLDDVMGTLDELRDGGRVVGVVSHVAEMRTRIPMQLAVAKDRHGSAVSVTRLCD